VVFETLFPKAQRTAIVTSLERITQPVADFIRGNPIVSTAAVGIGTTGLVTGISAVRGAVKRRKAKKTKKRRKVSKRAKTRKTKKRKVTRRRKKKCRRIIRGRGLGCKEIKHSGRKTKGKFKLVSFRDKRTGKMVRFKAKR